MVSVYANAKLEATRIANELIDITTSDFFAAFQAKFYSEIDTRFMKYYLLISRCEGEFIIHHNRLFQYGVVSMPSLAKVESKLKQLGMVDSIDFKYDKQQCNMYLTPATFKMCLMRARKYAAHVIDPARYAKAYVELEMIQKLYNHYRELYLTNLIKGPLLQMIEVQRISEKQLVKTWNAKCMKIGHKSNIRNIVSFLKTNQLYTFIHDSNTFTLNDGIYIAINQTQLNQLKSQEWVVLERAKFENAECYINRAKILWNMGLKLFFVITDDASEFALANNYRWIHFTNDRIVKLLS